MADTAADLLRETDYEAVVFDNDGVLIELTDEEVLLDAARGALEEFGVDPPDWLVEEFLHVQEIPEDHLRDEHDVDPAAVWERRETEATAVQREAILAGEKALYEDAHAIAELDHDCAVVSNNQHETIEFVLEHHGLVEHFEIAYGRDPTLEGLRRKKPHPHYVERALDALGTRDALYVGDSQKDVVAADRAGIDSAFVRRDHRRGLTLDPEPACEVPDLRTLVDALRDCNRP